MSSFSNIIVCGGACVCMYTHRTVSPDKINYYHQTRLIFIISDIFLTVPSSTVNNQSQHTVQSRREQPFLDHLQALLLIFITHYHYVFFSKWTNLAKNVKNILTVTSLTLNNLFKSIFASHFNTNISLLQHQVHIRSISPA